MFLRRWRSVAALVAGIAGLLNAHADSALADFVLSDNTSSASAGTDAATGTTWLADSFGSGTTATTLTSITLLLANPTSGKAVVSLYSDGGLSPGSLLGTLSSPSNFTTALGSETFTASGINLVANTTYWVVLSAASGEFDWSYSSTTTGTGVGFQADYAQSPDSGSSWFYYADAPYQMTVTVSAASVPEPASWTLCVLGLVGLGVYTRRRASGRSPENL